MACRICNCIPKQPKNRRLIFSSAFKVNNELEKVLEYVPTKEDGLSYYVCDLCFNKLNKLSKLNLEIATRVEKLKEEREKLYVTLRNKHDTSKKPMTIQETPTKDRKRMIQHTPTPRKTKKIITQEHSYASSVSLKFPETPQKPLTSHSNDFASPLAKTPEPKSPVSSKVPTKLPPVKKSKQHPTSTLTSKRPVRKSLFTPTKLKVIYQQQGQKQAPRMQSHYIIRGKLQTIVRQISRKMPSKTVARTILDTPDLKKEIMSSMKNSIKQELKALCSTNQPSILRQIKSDNLAQFSVTSFCWELKLRCPLAYSFMESLGCESDPAVAMTAAIFLKYRNKHMSAMHHIISQVLDNGGATDDLIYQQFYNAESAMDRGGLYHLRNVITRIDVRGPDEVIQKYRAHNSFVEDCLDAYVVAAYMHLNNTDTFDDLAHPDVQDERKHEFLLAVSKEILDKYVKTPEGFASLGAKVDELDTDSTRLDDLLQDGRYRCPNCDKSYKVRHHFKTHLSKKHDWTFATPSYSKDKENNIDRVALYRGSFMKCALLLKDINDAYKMGDGDRVFLTSKFQMLLSRVGKHTKYQLWLFRFIANCISMLTPREAYEYMWNVTANLHGSEFNNIPNDNLVELLVQAVKKKIKSQGANATFTSARKAALSMQIQEEITQNIQDEFLKKKKGKQRPPVSKSEDVRLMVSELTKAGLFDTIPGRQFSGFATFKEIYSRVKIPELYQWLTDNKARLSHETA